MFTGRKTVLTLPPAMLLMLSAAAAGQNTQVDLELALLADMSGSVGQTGFDLQRQGYIDAFRDPSVASAIADGSLGAISVSMVYWDSSPSQIVPWTLIDGSAGNTTSDFAQLLEDDPSGFFDFGGGTDMTEALNSIAQNGANGAITAFGENSFDGTRRVIDMSTDGSPNDPQDAEQAAQDALADDVDTINAIGVAGADVEFLEDSIVGGPDSFVVTAEGFEDFADAILQKLIAEIAGDLSREVSLQSARETAPALFDVARHVTRLQWTNVGTRLDDRRADLQGSVMLARLDNASTADAGPVAMSSFGSEGTLFSRGAAGGRQPGALPDEEGPETDDRGMLPHRPVETGENRFGSFASVRGIVGEHTSGPSDDDYFVAGGTAGLDYRFGENIVLGVAGGYDRSEVNLPHDGELTMRAPSISFYGTWTPADQLYVDGAFTYAHLDIEQDRRFRAGNATGRAESDFNADQYALQGRVGYDFLIEDWTIGPILGLSYIRTNIDGYTERGDNPLTVEAQYVDSLRSRLGGHVSYIWQRHEQTIVPQFRFAWVHEFMDDGRIIDANFSGPPARVTIPVDDPDRNFFEIGGGLSAQIDDNASVFINYDTTLGNSDLDSHMISAGLRILF